MIESGNKEGTGYYSTLSEAAAALDRIDSEQEQEETQSEETETETEQEGQSSEESEHEKEEETQTEQGDSEEQSGEEEEETQQESRPRSYKVKADGEELEVTEDELIKGYSRNADYTRKTQQLAEERKKLETDANERSALANRYVAGLAEIEAALTGNAQEPDWATLRQGEPAEFAAAWAAWDQHNKSLEAVRKEKETVQQKLRNDALESRKRLLVEEGQKLIEAIPEWKNEEVAKKERLELVEHALSRGFTAEDLEQVADHRVVKLLRDALQFEKSQKKAAVTKPVVQRKIEAAKVAAPGPAAKNRKPVSDVTKAKQKLAKTGSIKDAAALLDLMDD